MSLTNKDEIIDALELKGWFYQDLFVDRELTHVVLHEMKNKLTQFTPAGIGIGDTKNLNASIRQSSTLWIENWQESLGLENLHHILNEHMQLLKRSFFLPLKRFESQMAFYPDGGFYKKHLDQHAGTQNRLVTNLFYLNDCTEGGELVIYNKNDHNKIDAVIEPKAGSFVTFFSSEIYHEVRPTLSERFSLTTWMRNDEELP